MPLDASVELLHVSKRFHTTLAVHDMTLRLHEGEFFALLGPSGCGKSTTLRLISGLDTPDSGEIRIGGEVVTQHPPYARHVNMVFQHYALFPHLTVYENVAFGLRVTLARRSPETEIAKRVDAALALVHLDGLASRRPHQLSGGQQQRVALARALILQPRVLLLDEPLGALDRQLRKTMQTELRRLQRTLHMTFLYVTHDQDEALSMADRLAIMRQGQIEQLGTPQAVFHTPRTRFVADFMGATNVLTGRVTARMSDTVCVQTASGLSLITHAPQPVALGATLALVVRPDAVQVLPAHWAWTGENAFPGRLTNKAYLGEMTELTVLLACGEVLQSRIPSRLEQQFGYEDNAAVLVGWQAHDSHVLEETAAGFPGVEATGRSPRLG